MVFHLQNLQPLQGLQYVELFAGEANVFAEVKSQGFGGVAADIEYAAYFPDLLKGCKTNPFDILSTSGLALSVWMILNMEPHNSVLIMATVCSSFSSINVGTSRRSILLPEGRTDLAYISRGNCMMSRTVLLAMLATSLGISFMVENPGSSLMPYFHRWTSFAMTIRVFKISWWMRHYGACTPKRHVGLCNNVWFDRLNLGKLTKKDRKGCTTKTVVKYVSKSGRPSYKGTSALKSTQVYPRRFGEKVCQLMPKLMTEARGQPDASQLDPRPGPQVLSDLPWTDWEDADLCGVLRYVRGSKHLCLSPEWKEGLPRAV